MKQILLIGSTVVDVLIRVPRLPGRGDDVNISASSMRLGGCAFNTAMALQKFGVPHLLCSPVGRGVYGEFVAEQLAALGRKVFIRLEEENGCCYCLVEPDGERSFLSLHGAEYRFQRTWMDEVDLNAADSVFVCGLELEEPTGEEIVEFVCAQPHLALYLAPGPRIMEIPQARMERLLDRQPVLHLNRREAMLFTGAANAEAAGALLHRRTGRLVVLTCGAEGAWRFSDGSGEFFPSPVVAAVNTTGAGDAHCGALIACLKQGRPIREAMLAANQCGAEAASRPF
jgi:sugar/nucleoside kinase (ribokinase family)